VQKIVSKPKILIEYCPLGRTLKKRSQYSLVFLFVFVRFFVVVVVGGGGGGGGGGGSGVVVVDLTVMYVMFQLLLHYHDFTKQFSKARAYFH
jgi:hypothetical protein